MVEATIFLTGLFLFLAATTMFPALKKREEYNSINMLVSFTNLVSYAVLFAGINSFISAGGEGIYPTRWLFYIISCGLLMYEVGGILKKTKSEKIEMIFFNSLVMLTGYFASITIAPYKWIFFSISSAAFISVLLIIHRNDKKNTRFTNDVKTYVTLTWSAFPAIWILAPTGIGVLSAAGTAVLYLLLDIITKVLFGYYVITKKV